LTQGGEPKVTDSEIYSDTQTKILAIANELESASTHTLALAIRLFCEGKTSEFKIAVEQMEETGGRGIFGRLSIDGDNIEAIIGNEMWMQDHEAVFPSTSSPLLETWKSQGKSVVVMAIRTISASPKDPETSFKVVAQFAVSDPLRKEAPLVVSSSRDKG